MRIPCFFKPGIFEAAYVVAVLESDALGMRETIELLVDTGASRTTICDKDAIRLGIDFGKLEKLGEGMLGIGGSVDTYVLKDVKLVFRREDEKGYVENFERIYVLKHAVLDERIMRIPSILGRDILNKYALIYDKKHEKAYITDEALT
ncbi:MAG: retroviral-like aspartic protease family protein [Candidatus Bathyarchaeota archaeon]|nr:retroviral-like aspartic protease family protein [Candidatus Bathyarchaeota archaeon]